jgi:diacylglycerol kinase family enzyme
MSEPQPDEKSLTSAVKLRRVEAVVNVASGSTGQAAPAALTALLDEAGLEHRVTAPAPGELMTALKAAVDRAPDLLIVLAGDGTARAAAELCGMHGPLVAPLPGGTMNMLPKAVYGSADWRVALARTLTDGEVETLGGGEVMGNRFLVAAILGAPALWGPAREAAREVKLRKAIVWARLALRNSFSGRLRYTVDGGPQRRAGALVYMCPIVSRALPSDAEELEVAGLTPSGPMEAGRLGFHAMFGDWRDDASVDVERCRRTQVLSRTRIPALLDGELVRLPPRAEVRFRPDVVRVLAPPKEPPGDSEA